MYLLALASMLKGSLGAETHRTAALNFALLRGGKKHGVAYTSEAGGGASFLRLGVVL